MLLHCFTVPFICDSIIGAVASSHSLEGLLVVDFRVRYIHTCLPEMGGTSSVLVHSDILLYSAATSASAAEPMTILRMVAGNDNNNIMFNF